MQQSMTDGLRVVSTEIENLVGIVINKIVM